MATIAEQGVEGVVAVGWIGLSAPARTDFVYFAPYVPHQELNPDESETVDFVVVRSDNEKIVVALDDKPVKRPERLY